MFRLVNSAKFQIFDQCFKTSKWTTWSGLKCHSNLQMKSKSTLHSACDQRCIPGLCLHLHCAMLILNFVLNDNHSDWQYDISPRIITTVLLVVPQ